MKRGQATIIGLIMTFIALILALALIPAINTVVTAANLTAGSPEAIMAGLFPFFIIAGVLIGFLVYVVPQRQQ